TEPMSLAWERGHVARQKEERVDERGRIVNPCKSPVISHAREIQARQSLLGALQHLGGGLVKNNENASAPAHTLSPLIPTTHGVSAVISIAAMHTSRSHRLRNKPDQAEAPTNRMSAIVDACRPLQIARPRQPDRIYRECAAT